MREPLDDAEVDVDLAGPEDAGELLTLQRAAFLRDAQLYGDAFLPSLVQTVDELRAVLADPDYVVLVARLGHRMIGSVRSHQADRVGHIGRLMTAPDLEGYGIGGRLLAEIERRLSPRVDRFELATGAKSAANIAMYARRGYVETEQRTNSAGIRVVMMAKPAASTSPD